MKLSGTTYSIQVKFSCTLFWSNSSEVIMYFLLIQLQWSYPVIPFDPTKVKLSCTTFWSNSSEVIIYFFLIQPMWSYPVHYFTLRKQSCPVQPLAPSQLQSPFQPLCSNPSEEAPLFDTWTITKRPLKAISDWIRSEPPLGLPASLYWVWAGSVSRFSAYYQQSGSHGLLHF